MRILPKINCST